MHIVVMGVSGCGKSTVGSALADALGLPFVDGDDLHPQANVDKMAAGIPLGDDDRWPWLADVAAWLAGQAGGGVITSSCLKRAYRDLVRASAPGAVFVHLHAPQAVLEARVVARRESEGHFAAPGILDGQYADLEWPGDDEAHLDLDVSTHDAASAVAAATAWATRLAG